MRSSRHRFALCYTMISEAKANSHDQEGHLTKVAHIHRHPIKGFPAEALEDAELIEGRGLPLDRHFAFVSGMREDVPEPGKWSHSRTFLILTDFPELATFSCELARDEKTLLISSSQSEAAEVVIGSPDTYIAASDILARNFGDGPHGTPRLVEQKPGHGNWDFPDTPISIINLATVREISKAAGRELEKERFRGNFYIDGLEPWEELAWPGSRIRIGEAELDVLRPIKRCAMTSTEPGTGLREVDVPGAMSDAFGHLFCGVYCRVVTSGRVEPGDEIAVVRRGALDPHQNLPELAPDPAMWPQYANVTRGADGMIEVAPTQFIAAKAGQKIRIHALSFGDDSRRVEVVGSTDRAWRIETIEGLGERVLVSGPFGRG